MSDTNQDFDCSSSEASSPDSKSSSGGRKRSGPRQSRRKERQRPTGSNAARERSRVKTLRSAFLELQKTLPSVPPDTKLSKLDVLVLATTYIAHLMRTLDSGEDTPESREKQHRLQATGYLHPVKKWPMRSRLYIGAMENAAALAEGREPEECCGGLDVRECCLNSSEDEHSPIHAAHSH
ncbi:TCF24 [Branchiostoma lanceolatum]|uniref:TCF24 protein n=2 Tax=Branchiostoma TaxID=7737 RepID=A0A8K0EKE8_BRALA|nr:TCF24 [Branchiostoma lanceolatum]